VLGATYVGFLMGEALRPASRFLRVSILGALYALLGACAMSLPQEPIRRALVRDMEKIVDSEEQLKGWVVDDAEIRLVINDAMLSVCRVPPEDRAAAIQWLGEEIKREDGPVAAAWRRHGKNKNAVATLELLTRAKALLAEAHRWADDGKCPFWIEPVDHFDGRQTFAHRLLFSGEGGGRFSFGLEKTGTQPTVIGLGAGGAGRFMGGYGVSDSLTLLVGGEMALGGRLTAPGGVVITLTGLAAARVNVLSGYLEFETGPQDYINQTTGQKQLGFHAAVGVGTTSLRSFGGFVSGSVLSVSYDYTYGQTSDGERTHANLLTLGVRATYAFSR
jgi:hypothetical protein